MWVCFLVFDYGLDIPPMSKGIDVCTSQGDTNFVVRSADIIGVAKETPAAVRSSNAHDIVVEWGYSRSKLHNKNLSSSDYSWFSLRPRPKTCLHVLAMFGYLVVSLSPFIHSGQTDARMIHVKHVEDLSLCNIYFKYTTCIGL